MSTELVKTPETPISIIAQAALNNDVPVEKLQAMFDLETAWQEREAKKDFCKAIADFQHRCPVVKNEDLANGKRYAKLDRIWKQIRPLIKECGLALTWDSCSFDEKRNMCIIDGTLYHTGGYSKPIHGEVSIPELIRGQNSAQVSGSAQTYAKRYATRAALGIQTGEDDDDGNACTTDQPITKEQQKIILSLINDAEFAEDRILKAIKYGGGNSEIKEIMQSKFADLVVLLKTAITRIQKDRRGK